MRRRSRTIVPAGDRGLGPVRRRGLCLGGQALHASVGVRADGADYSARMARFWRQLSPRASVSYQLGKGWLLSGSAGLYYQLPPYTALGFKQDGVLVNEALDTCVWECSASEADGACATAWSSRSRGSTRNTGISRFPSRTASRSRAKATTMAWSATKRCARRRRAVVRHRGDGALADTREGQPRRFGDPVPQ